jgi:23S rRNA (adenine2030-N6)-methyltransferase
MFRPGPAVGGGMNYRHAFHAGNFADLFKHALLLAVLAELQASKGALTVVDSHAGAGTYDLAGEAARRTGESAAARRMMDERAIPAVFAPLAAAVVRLNGGRRGSLYPGSPWLIAQALRPQDRMLACELRADDAAALKAALAGRGGVETLVGDGWRLAAQRAPAAPARLLVLIDPPFEAGDDGAQAAALIGRILGRNPAAVAAVWAPIKDLAGFDALCGEIEDAAGERPVLIAEARLRAPDDPLRLNGCAMIIVNPTRGLGAQAREAAAWIAATFGDGDGADGLRR